MKIVSFGFKYADVPQAGPGVLVIDVRTYLPRNPHRIKGLRNLRGTDEAVAADIRAQPGFAEAYARLAGFISPYLPHIHTLYLGCTGGRHRSVYIAERLGDFFAARVEHRDIWRTE